ncbi:MAG: hypothetical protein M3N04_00875 [Actinomycetota bacterium]|nr:hypothetical protein [Actinomycetota bacterium]
MKREVVDGARRSVHHGRVSPRVRSCAPRRCREHRGRVFLPFADDDPKTAEVVAKILLLARDSEIRDPTILEQLRN